MGVGGRGVEAVSSASVSEQEKHIDRFAEANQLIRGRAQCECREAKTIMSKTGRDQKRTHGRQGQGLETAAAAGTKAQNVRMPGQGDAVEKLMISGQRERARVRERARASGGGTRERASERANGCWAAARFPDNLDDFTTEPRENPNE